MYYVLIYLLIGTGVGFALESAVRWNGGDVNGWERFSLITTWPIMAFAFIFNFIKGFFK